MVKTAKELWYVYIGPKCKDFTYGQTYSIYTGGSKERGFLTETDQGDKSSFVSVLLKDNFIGFWKYSQYLRKLKLQKLNEIR